MTRQQHRVINEAKRARERAIARGDIRRVHGLNALIARTRRSAEAADERP